MTVVFVHDELLVCASFILGYIWQVYGVSRSTMVGHFMLSSFFLLTTAVFHFLVDKGIHHGSFGGQHARRAFVYSIARM